MQFSNQKCICIDDLLRNWNDIVIIAFVKRNLLVKWVRAPEKIRSRYNYTCYGTQLSISMTNY